MPRTTVEEARARSDPEPPHPQVNQYDKILRENMEMTLPGLMKKLLGIEAVESEELPDDIQHTKERKPDVLKQITDKNGQTFVLHLEFQRTDEKEMPWRMAEYYIMLSRRHKLPVVQYVIYMGEGIPRMADHIRSNRMQFEYTLISLSSIDYQLLLNADNPGEKMLAILGDLGKNDFGQVFETIANQIVATSEGEFAALRHLQQLRILAQLRTFEPENTAIMESILPLMIEKRKTDFLYLIGEREGREEGREEERALLIKRLLLDTDLAVSKIADLVDVPEDFVLKVKESLHS